MYNPDVIGTESWRKEDISNAEVFRADFTTFRRHRCARGGGVFICVKHHCFNEVMARWGFWDDRSRSERNGSKIYVGNYTYLQSFKWGYVGDWKISSPYLTYAKFDKGKHYRGWFEFTQADWKGGAEKANGFQACVNILVWDNGYTQAVSSPTRGDALLDIYLRRPECLLISCNIFPWISDHNGVLEWTVICREPRAEKQVPMYHKTDVLALQAFLREKFYLWPGNGSCVES